MKAILYTDGGARGNPGPAASACILFDESMHLLDFEARYAGEITNNQAEYGALKLGIDLALKHGVTELACFLDSELVVKQMRGEYKIKDEKIKVAVSQIQKAVESLKVVKFEHVARARNHFADKLVNLVLDARQA